MVSVAALERDRSLRSAFWCALGREGKDIPGSGHAGRDPHRRPPVADAVHGGVDPHRALVDCRPEQPSIVSSLHRRARKLGDYLDVPAYRVSADPHGARVSAGHTGNTSVWFLH